MPENPLEHLTARQLSDAIAGAIRGVLETESRASIEPATELIRSQSEIDPDVALDIVEMVARRMQGLTSMLEASDDTTKALTLVEATVEVLEALRSSVPASDREAFDTLLAPGERLKAALRRRIEAGPDPAPDAERDPSQALPQTFSRGRVPRTPSPSAFGDPGRSARGIRTAKSRSDRSPEGDRPSSIERGLE